MKYMKYIFSILLTTVVIGLVGFVNTPKAHASYGISGGFLCYVYAYSRQNSGQFGYLGYNTCTTFGDVLLTGEIQQLIPQRCYGSGPNHNCDGTWQNLLPGNVCNNDTEGSSTNIYCEPNRVYTYIVTTHGYWYRMWDHAIKYSTIGSASGDDYSSAIYFP